MIIWWIWRKALQVCAATAGRSVKVSSTRSRGLNQGFGFVQDVHYRMVGRCRFARDSASMKQQSRADLIGAGPCSCRVHACCCWCVLLRMQCDTAGDRQTGERTHQLLLHLVGHVGALVLLPQALELGMILRRKDEGMENKVWEGPEQGSRA